MRKPEVRKAIETSLKPLIKPVGFKRHAELGFIRYWPGGFDSISVPLIDYRPLFKFTLVFGIRLDCVETITNRFCNVAPGFEAITTTVLFRLDYFTGRFQTEYVITTEDELHEALREPLDILTQEVFPTFERCRTPEGLYTTINNTPRAGIEFNATVLPDRAMSHVTLAHLCDPIAIESLIARYNREMCNTVAQARQPYEQLVEYVRHTVFTARKR